MNRIGASDLPSVTTILPEEPQWYRSPDAVDHAFGPGSSWMRSRCGIVRWTVLLTPALSGPTDPCPDCLAEIGPTEGEARAGRESMTSWERCPRCGRVMEVGDRCRRCG